MPEKKSYSPPQLVRVELNHEQAILSVCSTSAGTAMVGGAATNCRSGSCKNGNNGVGADNAARAS